MTDPRVAALDAKKKRVDEAFVALIVIGAGYFFVMIWVFNEFRLSQLATVLVFLPFPIIIVVAMVLRIRSRWLGSDAALEQARATLESINKLDTELNESKRRNRAAEHGGQG